MRPRGRRLIRGIGRTAVVAGTAGVVSGRVHHHQREKWEREQQEEYEQQYGAQQLAAPTAAPAAAPPAPVDEDDLIDKVKDLSSLHESGVLTDEEFTAAKAKLFSQ
jgi:hypothetical protein